MAGGDANDGAGWLYPPGGTEGIDGCGAWLVPLGQLGPVPITPPKPLPMPVEPPIGPPGAIPWACVAALTSIRAVAAAAMNMLLMSGISVA